MVKKNRNGMGSVRQRADGRYEARYTGTDGKQHSVFAHTSTEASKKLRAATAAVDRGDWLKPSRLTVADWLDTWLRDYCAHIRPSTRLHYQSHIAHIKASIGLIRLSQIKQTHVRRVLSDAQSAGLAPGTVNGIRVTLSTALRRAVEDHLLPDNPAALVRLPKAQPLRNMHIVDRPQIPAFIAAARKTNYANELIFLLLTGLRVGELLGLTWDRVDLDKGRIVVSRQLVRRGRGYALTDTKTGTARELYLMPEAVAILRAQRAKQAEDRMRAGGTWISGELYDQLVFRTPQGRHLLLTVLGHALHKVGQDIGMPELHPHDLRHSYAVAALRAGMDVKTVQHNLGHSSAAMTLDVYARYTDDAAAASTQRLASYFDDAALGSN